MANVDWCTMDKNQSQMDAFLKWFHGLTGCNGAESESSQESSNQSYNYPIPSCEICTQVESDNLILARTVLAVFADMKIGMSREFEMKFFRFRNLRVELETADKNSDVVKVFTRLIVEMMQTLGPFMLLCSDSMETEFGGTELIDIFDKLGITVADDPGGPGGTPKYCPTWQRMHDPGIEHCPDFE